MPGFVYLFRKGDLHKIGQSANPEARLEQVARGGLIVHLIESANPRSVERMLHWRFNAARVRGEWFRLAESEVRDVCRVLRADAATDLPEGLQAERPLPTTVAFQFRCPGPLHRALALLVTDTRRTKNTELILAVEAYLASLGKWPVQPKGQSKEDE